MTHLSKAIFAAGCFWGVEETFRCLPGVIKTTVGYTGGDFANPTYEDVCSGVTGHAEAVEITFDPERISFEQLLDTFWRSHDPTTKNRQCPDIGSQYRSAIFYHDETQREAAIRVRDGQPHADRIVTEITAATTFWPAEDYHQAYLAKRGRGSCRL